MKIIVDEKEISGKPGEKILWTCLDNGIYIPNLCAIREQKLPFGGCRICLVEIEVRGKRRIVTSCSEIVKDGMKVFTNTERVNRLRKTAFELLMTDHYIDCRNCGKRKNCQLLKIAGYLKIKIEPKRFKKLERNLPIDSSHKIFTYNPNKCIRCGKCVFVCQEQKCGVFNFANRGIETIISTFENLPLEKTNCHSCLECVKICPTGALLKKDES
jgi:formate dehydrogenase major subunit/NADH-quinone oxidoreductase subunit G